MRARGCTCHDWRVCLLCREVPYEDAKVFDSGSDTDRFGGGGGVQARRVMDIETKLALIQMYELTRYQ